MDISDIIEPLQNGKDIHNKDWGPKTFMFLIKSNEFSSKFKYGYGEYEGEPSFNSQLALYNGTNNTIEVGYRLSYTDLISKNYYVDKIILGE